MSVLDKAREMGTELSKSNELINLREAEAVMLENPEAQKIIREFNEKQRVIQMIQSQGLPITEGQRKEIEDLERNMFENPYIFNFFRTQQTFEKVLEEINNIISEAIRSNSGCSCESGCGDSFCDSDGCD